MCCKWLFVLFISYLINNIRADTSETKCSSPQTCFDRQSLPEKSQTVVANFELSNLINKLWSLDKNRAQFGTDVRLSLQGRVPWYDNGRDAATYPLFFNVNNDIFNKPTYKAFVSLLDNYDHNSGVREKITNEEINENYNFLNQVMNTPIMNEVYSYLKKLGKASPVVSQFKHQLYDLWFAPYYRSSFDRVQDSSGFEHVFVGEINRNKNIVSGFHNWIQFYLQEKSNQLNYLGYLKTSTTSNSLLMMRFEWQNNIKVIGSSFMGVSPEFEFSLYTLVYMLDFEELQFKLDGMDVKITCFGIYRRKHIGTCYPDLL